MYNFNIPFPKEVLTDKRHDEIDFSLMENKIIIGLMGYAKSGKDFIAKKFIEDYGYQRVAFADNIKHELNKYFKEAIYTDAANGSESILWKSQYGINEPSELDFFTENLELKKVLRPYITWYGEEMRNRNGRFYWINRAFSEDAKNMEKVVLSDVRRTAELDIFRNSNEFYKRQEKAFLEAGVTELPKRNTNNFGTLLFEVSQMGLRDFDALTCDCIRVANEDWLVDEKFLVNPNIPETGNHRNKAMLTQIKNVVNKFGIDKVKKHSINQVSIYDVINGEGA